MTDFLTLLYISTIEIPNPFCAEPPRIGHYREYPQGLLIVFFECICQTCFCSTLTAVKDCSEYFSFGLKRHAKQQCLLMRKVIF